MIEMRSKALYVYCFICAVIHFAILIMYLEAVLPNFVDVFAKQYVRQGLLSWSNVVLGASVSVSSRHGKYGAFAYLNRCYWSILEPDNLEVGIFRLLSLWEDDKDERQCILRSWCDLTELLQSCKTFQPCRLQWDPLALDS